ncbi:kanadaptin isoform X2 [Tanacetum coccineum]
MVMWCCSNNSRVSPFHLHELVNISLGPGAKTIGKPVVFNGESNLTYVVIDGSIGAGVWRDRMWPDGWTAVTADGKRVAQFEHTLLALGSEFLTRNMWILNSVVSESFADPLRHLSVMNFVFLLQYRALKILLKIQALRLSQYRSTVREKQIAYSTGFPTLVNAVHISNARGRIGAVDKKETKKPQEAPVVEEEANEFVDYKDIKEALAKKESTKMDVDLGLKNAAPGLIIRKREQVEETDKVKSGNSVSVESSPAGVDIAAEDAVTLLLRHSRGVQAMDDEVMRSGEGDTRADKGKKGKRKAKKVLGPERPSFLDGETDYESWVPPQGRDCVMEDGIFQLFITNKGTHSTGTGGSVLLMTRLDAAADAAFDVSLGDGLKKV